MDDDVCLIDAGLLVHSSGKQDDLLAPTWVQTIPSIPAQCVTAQPSPAKLPTQDEQPCLMRTQGTHFVEKKKAKRMRVFGILHILLGMGLVAVNITGICKGADIPGAIVGIVGGVFAFGAGCSGLVAAQKLTRRSLKWYMGLSVLMIILAACVVGLSARAIDQEFSNGYIRIPRTTTTTTTTTTRERWDEEGWGSHRYGSSRYEYDDYDRYDYVWTGKPRQVLDGVSVALGAVELIVAFVTFVFLCCALCPCKSGRKMHLKEGEAFSIMQVGQPTVKPTAAAQWTMQFGNSGAASCSINCFCPTCCSYPDSESD